jgi:hypothetical protein
MFYFISKLKSFIYFRFDAAGFVVERFLELFVVPLDTVVGLGAVLRSGTS